MVNKFVKRLYTTLIFLFLYAPIIILIVFSFNSSKSRGTWDSFTFKWYIELFKNQEKLIKPIQDDIYEAVKDISAENGYAVVVDRASATSIIFATPEIDISEEVLSRLGY